MAESTRRRALLTRLTQPNVHYYNGGISKISSPHVVFAFLSDDALRPLIASQKDKIDILAFITRLEFYLNTAHHWSIAVMPDATRDIGWWARRAALDDIFGGTATDLDATRLNDPNRTLTKFRLARTICKKQDQVVQVWSCTSNMVSWADIKSIAYDEFKGGQKPIWKRAIKCQSTQIGMKRPGYLIDRMIRLTSLVAGDPPMSAWTEGPGQMGSGLLSPGMGKKTNRAGSTVSVNEVEADQ